MRFRLLLMQFEIGMSTSRYLPAKGTAGLERSLVNGNNRVPAPPPMITESTLLVFGDSRLLCVIPKILSCECLSPVYTLPNLKRASDIMRLRNRYVRHRRLHRQATGSPYHRRGAPTP